MKRNLHRALVAGWFSFEGRKATFGDVHAMEVVRPWLEELDCPYDIAGQPQNRVDGVDINLIDPKEYSIFIFVCGPWGGGGSLLQRFSHCLKIGVDLSIRNSSHGFDLIFPREFASTHAPDLAFDAKSNEVDVVGVALVHPQPAFGERQRHAEVQMAVDRYFESSGAARIQLDTLLHENTAGIEGVAQLEAMIRRVDVVITSRLHGLVYSLKNGIPAVAIDPIAGGAKLTSQASALNWPILLEGDGIDSGKIALAIQHAKTMDAKRLIEESLQTAKREIEQIKKVFSIKSQGGWIPIALTPTFRRSDFLSA
jgi:hypothetical protein